MSRRVFYPTVFNAPVAPAAAPSGWEPVAPSATRRPTRQQPPGQTSVPLPPAEAPRGWDSFAPNVRRAPARQQPGGESHVPLPPAEAPQGWDVVAPSRPTVRPVPRQAPQPPDVLPVTAEPNTEFGADCFAPPTTLRVPRQQPPSVTFVELEPPEVPAGGGVCATISVTARVTAAVSVTARVTAATSVAPRVNGTVSVEVC